MGRSYKKLWGIWRVFGFFVREATQWCKNHDQNTTNTCTCYLSRAKGEHRAHPHAGTKQHVGCAMHVDGTMTLPPRGHCCTVVLCQACTIGSATCMVLSIISDRLKEGLCSTHSQSSHALRWLFVAENSLKVCFQRWHSSSLERKPCKLFNELNNAYKPG